MISNAVSSASRRTVVLMTASVGALATAGSLTTASAPGSRSIDGSVSSAGNANGNNGSGNGNGGSTGSATGNRSFTITGAAVGLAPGVPTAFTLTLRNNAPQGVRVVSIEAAATGTVSCPESHLRLGSPLTASSGRINPVGVTIPANGTSTTSFPVLLVASAPNSCKGTTFALRYTGTGEQA